MKFEKNLNNIRLLTRISFQRHIFLLILVKLVKFGSDSKASKSHQTSLVIITVFTLLFIEVQLIKYS